MAPPGGRLRWARPRWSFRPQRARAPSNVVPTAPAEGRAIIAPPDGNAQNAPGKCRQSVAKVFLQHRTRRRAPGTGCVGRSGQASFAEEQRRPREFRAGGRPRRVPPRAVSVSPGSWPSSPCAGADSRAWLAGLVLCAIPARPRSTGSEREKCAPRRSRTRSCEP